MAWFSNQPIRRKLLFIVLATNFVALALAMAGIVLYEIATYRGRIERELGSEADFIATNAAPALAFGDRETARQILATVKYHPEVVAAGLYDPHDRLFASHAREGPPPPALIRPEPEGLWSTGRKIELVRAVVQKNRRLGTLYLRADTVTVEERLMPYAGIMLLVLLAISAGTLLLQALTRRLISEPLLRLGQMAKRIGEGDLRARVPIDSTDEIGQLAKTLNGMAGELVQSRVLLEESKEQLEIRVMERTRDLREAHDHLTKEMEEREKTEEQLRQAQKMEAVGVLAGGIAHDFNNVLAAVLGYTELALDETASPDVRHNLEQVLKASMRARDLVRQILAFSRKTERGRNPFRLAPLLKETYDLLRGTMLPTIQMRLEIDLAHDMVIGDPSQIQQIVMNLAANAAHAMREKGGVLTLALSKIALHEKKRIDGELSPGFYARLSVRDTGTGMSEDVRKRIFEPFYTTKGLGQGTGMGLSVVYGIVRNHGGDITVESKLGEGSEFNVLLPLAAEQTEATHEGEGDIPRGSERVLIVDDEPAVVHMMSQLLARLGYKVKSAGGGLEAWEIFERSVDAFDLVITDQIMPDLLGTALAEKISAARYGIPIILLTGYSEAMSPERTKEAGIRELLMKPVVKRELAEAVRRVLDSTPNTGTN